MSAYTKALTAEQLIAYIANDRPELSHDKIRWQRDDYIKICREWLEENANVDDMDTRESVMTAQEAAKLLLDGIRDPWHGDANIPGFADIDWQKVYNEMTADHNESLEICGTHDWPATLVTALSAIAGED